MTIAERLKLEGEQRGYEKGIHAGVQQGMEQGVQQGIAQGVEQGEYEARLNVARNMLSRNADIDFVKEVTGLSDQDIAKLVRNH